MKNYQKLGIDFEVDEIFFKININGTEFKIRHVHMSNDVLGYAYKIGEEYIQKKKEILKFVCEDLSQFYMGYTEEEIIDGLGTPYIEIIRDNMGVIVWLENKLDEHIIECEFGKDEMELYRVCVDG